MSDPTVAIFMGGAIAAGHLIVGVFFLRFWRRTGDGLFAVFALAFALLAAVQAVTALLGLPEEREAGAYLLRLAAFGLIIAAVLAKNIQAHRRRRDRRRLG